MSRPENPLSRYRSYNYYHVLCVCNTTATADALAEQTDPNKWMHPTGPQTGEGIDSSQDTFDMLGKYAVKYVKIPKQQDTYGKYCVLINGATDAGLTITRAKWDSITAAAATVMDHSTSVAVEGELNISEPKGVIFLDTLVNCCLAMGIDAANAIFVLKTFFVGYPDWKGSGDASVGDTIPTPEEFLITDIDPIRFVAYDITGSFGETGGQYQMNFVALAYGVPRLPQFSKTASGFSFDAGETLLDTFQRLQSVVRTNYDQLFRCVEDTVRSDPSTQDFAESLSRVKYTIELDEEYMHAGYSVSNTQSQSKDKDGCNTPSLLNFPSNMSIEDAIHLIMKHCPRVQSDMADGIERNGTRIHYEYKIHPAYSSVQVGNRIEHEVRYFVKRFLRPASINLFDLASNDEESVALRNNTIEFDYLYTGKNIDILEFDIKLNMGLQYLQIATINNTLKDQMQQTPSSIKHVPEMAKKQLGRFGQATQIPVMFGTQIKTPSLRNNQDISQSAEAGYSLSKHSSIEVQDASMRIYGNPRLLSSVNRSTSPSTIGVPDTGNKDAGSFYSWGTIPAFAKVNIRMPRNNDDIALFGQDVSDVGANGDIGFTKEFWFTGHYYVVAVEHVFDNGEFYQTLEMVGIPQSKATMAAQGQGESGLSTQKTIETCFDNTIPRTGAQPTSTNNTPAQLPHPTPSAIEEKLTEGTITNTVDSVGEQIASVTDKIPNVSDVVPTNLRDAEALTESAKNQISLDRVKGWTAAPTSIKESVTAAAAKYDVPVGNLAAIAAAESNFNPNAVNSLTKDATGLFQFIGSTWIGDKSKGTGVINKFGKQIGIDSSLSRQELLDLRKDPRISAEAAALLAKDDINIIKRTVGGSYEPTPYDSYLAHFAGGPMAGQVIKMDRINPNIALRTLYTPAGWEKVKKANPSLITENITVGEFREEMRGVLDARLGGAPVVQSNRVPPQATTPQPGQRAEASRTGADTNVTAGQKLASAKAPKTQQNDSMPEGTIGSSCNAQS